MKKILYSMLALAMATFTFTSCEDVPAPYDDPNSNGGDDNSSTVVITPTGEGTLESPYNVAAALEYTNALESDVEADKDIYIKGIVTSISENYTTDYGNATFYISDDADATNKFYVFRTLYLGNKKYTSGTQPQIGDEVIICGKVVNYKGNTPETVTNKSYLYSLNGKTSSDDSGSSTTGSAQGDGTLENPFNAVAANEYVSKLSADVNSDNNIYIKGKIASIKENFSTTYGNATFYISDDGKEENTFYVFRTLYLGNVKYTEGTLPQVGDDVVIYGKVVNYKGNTPETVQNQSYIYSLTSNGSSSGGNDNTTSAEGITISGTTVTLNNTAVTAGTETITVDLSALGYTNAQDVETITLSDGTTIVFDKNGETNGPKYYSATNGIRVYKNNTITFNGKANIAKIVMSCDSYNGTDYVGNDTATMSANGNKVVYTNVFTGSSGGGVQLRVKTITITYAK